MRKGIFAIAADVKFIGPILSQTLRGGAFVAGLASVIGAVAAQGGRWSDKLDGLSHFAPFWLIGGLLAGAVWLLAGRRGKLTPLFAAIAVLGASNLMAGEFVAASRMETVTPRDETLKIIQFNILERNTDLAATAAWILAQDADVIIAEEARFGSQPIVDALRKHYSYKIACWDAPGCGTLILSRKAPLDAKPDRKLSFGNGAMAWAQFEGLKGPYTIMGVHYVWPEPASPQWINRAAMKRNARAFPKDSLIITGDFNSTPWSFALRRQDRDLGLTRWTRAMPSWPTRLGGIEPPPFLPLDHVYTGNDWKLVSIKRGPKLGSDHYPVVVVLTR